VRPLPHEGEVMAKVYLERFGYAWYHRGEQRVSPDGRVFVSTQVFGDFGPTWVWGLRRRSG
jgi:hypothetical protein